MAARFTENGKLSEFIPSLDESRHRLAACAGTSTCHIVQVQCRLIIQTIICAVYSVSLEQARRVCKWRLGTVQGDRGVLGLFLHPRLQTCAGTSIPRMVDE